LAVVRLAGTHRYQLTTIGLRTALFYSRIFICVIRPGLSQIAHPNTSNLTAAFHHFEVQLTDYFAEKKAERRLFAGSTIFVIFFKKTLLQNFNCITLSSPCF
jgi:hypothetical protein